MMHAAITGAMVFFIDRALRVIVMGEVGRRLFNQYYPLAYYRFVVTIMMAAISSALVFYLGYTVQHMLVVFSVWLSIQTAYSFLLRRRGYRLDSTMTFNPFIFMAVSWLVLAIPRTGQIAQWSSSKGVEYGFLYGFIIVLFLLAVIILAAGLLAAADNAFKSGQGLGQLARGLGCVAGLVMVIAGVALLVFLYYVVSNPEKAVMIIIMVAVVIAVMVIHSKLKA